MEFVYANRTFPIGQNTALVVDLNISRTDIAMCDPRILPSSLVR
jgi:hypothetical protein